MTQPSIADQAICVLAEIRSIDDAIPSDHPMRHNAWKMKRTAENILEQAFRQASDLAQHAKWLIKEYDEAIKVKEPAQ